MRAALVTIQWLAEVAMTAGLASIGNWIAFGAGTSQFSMPLPVWGSLDEIIGRAEFSFGAIITSLTAAAFAAAGAKKIFGKKGERLIACKNFQCSRGALRNLARSDEFTATSKVTPSR
jgi:hypothetical protein